MSDDIYLSNISLVIFVNFLFLNVKFYLKLLRFEELGLKWEREQEAPLSIELDLLIKPEYNSTGQFLEKILTVIVNSD